MNDIGYIIRKTIALGVLGASLLVTLFVAWNEMRFTCGGFHWAALQQLVVLGILVVTAFVGVATNRVWGRWPGLAIGLLALWMVWTQVASSLLFGSYALLFWDWEWAFMAVSGVLLTGSLVGRTMYSRYEGREFGELPTRRWDRFRLLVVRWSAVVAITLIPFISASFFCGASGCGREISDWLYRSIMVGLGGAVIFGVALIARQKTVGVLVIAFAGSLAAWLFGSLGTYDGEINELEAACRAGHSLIYLLPALIFAGPMLKLLTGRDR